jgi:hypothetical protein
MSTQPSADQDLEEEYLQILIPTSTRTHLGIRAAESRETLRVVVLRALQAYGVPVPDEAMVDRRGRKGAT